MQADRSSSPSTSEEVRRDLGKFKASNSLVELYLVDKQTPICGFLIYLGEDYIVISRLFQLSWENGFRAIRTDRIEDVFEVDVERERDEDHEVMSEIFVRRARVARGLPDGPKLPLEASSFSGFLNIVCKHYPIVIMCGETPSGKSFDFAASVSSGDADSIQARLFEEDGYWQAHEQAVPVSEIYEVLFDSEYERTLVAMSQLDDA